MRAASSAFSRKAFHSGLLLHSSFASIFLKETGASPIVADYGAEQQEQRCDRVLSLNGGLQDPSLLSSINPLMVTAGDLMSYFSVLAGSQKDSELTLMPHVCVKFRG